MNDRAVTGMPPAYQGILSATIEINFNMASDILTGSLLKLLVASRPAGRFLELGTGTGLATAWIVEGLDEKSSLVTIDNNESLVAIARQFITDQRVSLLMVDAAEWLINYTGEQFDLVFADAMRGKYEQLDEALKLVKRGGFYIIDDMLPQPNWPAGHDERVAGLIAELESRSNLVVTKMNWSTGIIMVVKK
jgi:predicted O-methyltransferase YrrM